MGMRAESMGMCAESVKCIMLISSILQEVRVPPGGTHFLFIPDNQALTLHRIPDYLSDRRTRSARTMAVIASTTTGALSAKHTS